MNNQRQAGLGINLDVWGYGDRCADASGSGVDAGRTSWCGARGAAGANVGDNLFGLQADLRFWQVAAGVEAVAVVPVAAAADELVSERFLLPADRDDLVRQAEESQIRR